MVDNNIMLGLISGFQSNNMHAVQTNTENEQIDYKHYNKKG